MIVIVAVAVPQPGVWLLVTVTVAVPPASGIPVIVVPLHVKPAGSPSTFAIVPFVAVISMVSIELPRHTVWLEFVTVTSGNGFTVSVNSAVAVPQPGVWSLVTVTVTGNEPLTVGVPLIVVPL